MSSQGTYLVSSTIHLTEYGTDFWLIFPCTCYVWHERPVHLSKSDIKQRVDNAQSSRCATFIYVITSPRARTHLIDHNWSHVDVKKISIYLFILRTHLNALATWSNYLSWWPISTHLLAISWFYTSNRTNNGRHAHHYIRDDPMSHVLLCQSKGPSHSLGIFDTHVSESFRYKHGYINNLLS